MLEMTKGISQERRDYSNRRGGTVKNVGVYNIEVPEGREREIDDVTVQKIYDSLPLHGLIQPIGVRQNDSGLTLAYGEHRYRAWIQRYNESIEDGTLEDGRWGLIPCVVYESGTTDDDLKLLELHENLLRKDLTKSEKDRISAKVLKMLDSGSSQNKKVVKNKNKSMTTFKIPKQKEILELLNVNQTSFTRDFKAYQEQAGINVNWTKLDKGQYDGFIKFFEDRAEASKAEDEQKTNEDNMAKLNKAEKTYNDALIKIHNLVIKTVKDAKAYGLDDKSDSILNTVRKALGSIYQES